MELSIGKRLKMFAEMIKKADMDLLNEEEVRTLTNMHIVLTSYCIKGVWTHELLDDIGYKIYNILG